MFYKMRVDGDLQIKETLFKGEENNFDSINVSGTVFFEQTEFDNRFNLSNSVMSELECSDGNPDEHKLTAFKNKADFYNIRVTGNANLAYIQFEGQEVNFEGIDISKNLELTGAKFNNAGANIQFGSMKVAGNAIFNMAEFAGGFDMSKAEIGGNLEFTKTQAQNTNMTRNFSGMKVDTAIFDQTSLAPAYELQGVDYRLLNPQSKNYRENLDFIRNSKDNPNTFANLEAYYRRMGFVEAADQVFIAGREAEYCREGVFGKIWNWVLYLTVGYGKRLWQPLLWSILFIGLGTVVFWDEKNMAFQDKDEPTNYQYNP